MCGIVGYIGTKQAAPIILDGLSKLEYRGYDSAGMAVYDGNMHHEGSYIPNVHGGEDYLNLSGNGEAIMRYSDPLAHSNEFNMNPFDVNKY